ncbi:MAG: hypothetical protein WCI62_02360 [Erysipelotrichaceae bacterium]
MKEALYIHDTTALINFSTAYAQSPDELISSDSFKMVLQSYLNQLKINDPVLFAWISKGRTISETITKMIRSAKLLMVLDFAEIDNPDLHQADKLIKVIEDIYNYWRTLQRCTIVKISSSQSGQLSNFIEADTKFNSLVLTVYRGIQEKVQGHKNRVYRQLQAGSNASMVIRDIKWPLLLGYETLKGIAFVDSMLLRTPLLLHPKSSKRSGSFKIINTNPFDNLELNREEWFCYPAKVGKLYIWIYVHRDFAFSGISCANLFELASDQEVLKHKMDGILLFGLDDKLAESQYYYDKQNDIWIGKVSYGPLIDYFGYMKKMVLTLHNAIMMQRGWLPIHGSMVDIHFKNGKTVGVVFMGDSGAGKSETIEAMQLLGHTDLVGMDVIFDDMGTFHTENGQLVAQGTEIGAFIRLDDLDKGSPYKTMDRSIFMNPESVNARVVIPVSSYNMIIANHRVDYFLYANNYENHIGVKLAQKASDLKDVFVNGKRMAMQTTHETGISTTYFANPFGPMQNQSLCDPLIDHYFEVLDQTFIKTGEIYTGLGLIEKDEKHLELTAIALLELIQK